MENIALENALEDISLIKRIIENTRSSLAGLSKIFIYWGILFILYGFVNWFQNANLEDTIAFYNAHKYFMYLIPSIFAFLALTIYYLTTKNKKLIGLEKQLLLLWVLVLLLCTVPVRIDILNPNQPTTNAVTTVMMKINNFSTVAFALGIALIMTAVLADLKLLRYIGIGYILMSVVHGYLYISSVEAVINVIQYVLKPLTFICTGLYLKYQHERRIMDGHQLNS